MSDVSTEIDAFLEDLKDYLKIVIDDDDNNLKARLNTAHATLKTWCGQFELDNLIGRQLVFDYVRYMRAGASEYFYSNFKSQIIGFGFSLMEVPEDEISEKE